MIDVTESVNTTQNLFEATNSNELTTTTNTHIEYLKTLPEVQNLTSLIKLEDLNTVNNFGSKPSLELSKISDELLNITKEVSNKETFALFDPLNNILNKFDIEDFNKEPKKQGFLGKLFNNAKNTLDDLFKKYDTVGRELTSVSETLNKYKLDIVKSNKTIETLQQHNIKYFEELEKYIAAGEIAYDEANQIKTHFENLDNINEFEKSEKVEKATLLVDQIDKKVHELRVVQQIALQTIPMLNMMRRNNFDLANQVDSKILTTIPIFKSLIVQAITLHRQKIQANNLQELDRKTNEMLLKNATRTVDINKQLAGMENNGVKVETLEQTFNILKTGVIETENILKQNREKRINDTQKLENMKKEIIDSNFFKN